MILETLPQIHAMSATEKLLLVSELWDEISSHAEDVPVSREVMEELDRRAEEYVRDPSAVISWEDAKERVLNSSRT